MQTESMGTPAGTRQRGHAFWLSALQDLGLISLFGLFAYTHATRAITDHVFTAVPFAIENSLYAFLFITRRRSQATSTRWQDWAVAVLGGWLPLAFQPHDASSEFAAIAGTSIQMAGLLLACICLGFLGRSFGIVAADRGLKTHGAYAVVRHPVYAAHLITGAGFLVANFSWLNVSLAAIVLAAQLCRIRSEERLLEGSSDYATYKRTVRYRLVPGVY